MLSRVIQSQNPPEDAGPPRVLVIPGLNGDAGMLMDAAAELFPGMRPLAFDHHGDFAELGIEGLARRALAVLDDDRDGDAPAYLCGESFGGPVALTLARLRPDRVCGLLLFSTFGVYPIAARLGGRVGLALWRGVGGRKLTRSSGALRPFSLPGQLGFRFPKKVGRAYLARPQAHIRAYARKCELSLAFDATPWLDRLTMPAFVLVGNWDPVVPISAGRELVASLPRGRLYELPGGHLVHLVRARQVRDARRGMAWRHVRGDLIRNNSAEDFYASV